MANVFPTTLNDWESAEVIESAWADALEAKIGVDNSAVATSIDYLIKNAASKLGSIANVTPTDGVFLVADGSKFVGESGATARTSMGLGTGDTATLTGLLLSGLTASEIVITDGSKNLVSAAVATYPSLTELTYVKGVTSAIQTQIAGKSPTAGNASLVTVGTITTGVWNGTDIPVSAGGTGLSAIAALSTIVANSADTYVAITPGAGNSIRVNAGGTAWEAFTPSAGGIDNVVEDLSPQLGAALDGQGFDLNNMGVLFLTEQAEAEVDVAGKGQLWVNTAVPNELWFTDDAGTDFQLGTFTSTLLTKLNGIEALADVTDTTNVTAAGALMDSEVDADIKTLSLPASTTITAAAATVLDDATVAAMVDTLGGASATGTGGLVRATSPALVTPALGTPASGVMTNVTGVPAAAILAGSFGAGAYVISTSLQVATLELGHASDTTLSRSAAGVLAVEGVVVPTISSTNTLTNKRVTPRTGTTTSSATPTINTDNVDFYSLTAQAEDITSFTTNLSGTPTEGQKLWIAVTGTAARAITWGTSFASSGTVTLPVTTVTTTRLDVGFVWNTTTSKWMCIAVA